MRELREVLHEAFDRHARALGDGATDVAPPTALAEIRRRRTRGAFVAVGTAAAACLAIGVAVIAVPAIRGEDGTVAAPGGDRPAWCNLDTYPAVNTEALGPAGYSGRLYADYENNEFVVVQPDGTKVPAAEAGGMWEGMLADPHMPYAHFAFDSFGGGGGGGPYLESDEGPALGYEWTTVAPDEVPAGVSPQLLMEVHTLTLGFSGTGLEPSVAGADAVVESVIRYDDGSEEVVRIRRGEAGATINDYDGLVSASIRATLPSGETYEITSYYDESMTFENACGVELPLVADDTRDDFVDDNPFPDVPEWVAGPYLEGPESAVFQCLAPIPDDLVAEPTRFELKTGTYYDVEEAGIEFDFGDGGFIIAAPEETFAGVSGPGPQYTGWSGSWGGPEGGEVSGNVTYEAFVWVDPDGVIIGRQDHEPNEDDGRVAGGSADTTMSIGGGDYGDRLWYVGDVGGLAVPCDGVDPAALADAELAMIYGYGPSADDMTWMVFYPDRLG